MSFQTDGLSSAYDWLDFPPPRFDWLRAPRITLQLENLPKSDFMSLDFA